jgi:hypothetical protein
MSDVFAELCRLVAKSAPNDAEAVARIRELVLGGDTRAVLRETDKHGNSLLHLACGHGKQPFAQVRDPLAVFLQLYCALSSRDDQSFLLQIFANAGARLTRRTRIGYTAAELVPVAQRSDPWFLVCWGGLNGKFIPPQKGGSLC